MAHGGADDGDLSEPSERDEPWISICPNIWKYLKESLFMSITSSI